MRFFRKFIGGSKEPQLEPLKPEYRVFLHGERGYTSEQLDEFRARQVQTRMYNSETYAILRMTGGEPEHITTLGKRRNGGSIVEYDNTGKMIQD